MPALTRRGDRVLLTLRVVPCASANEVTTREGTVVVRVTAPPAEGQANDAVLRTLAKALDLAPSDVVLVRGATGRTKTVSLPAAVEPTLRRMVK